MAIAPGTLMSRACRMRVFTVSLLLLGCAARSFTQELDAAVGRLTKEEVVARFGSPTRVTQVDGEEAWVYAESGPSPGRPLTFGWLTIGSPYQADPLGPPGGDIGVPVQESLRSAPEGAASRTRREYLLFFDSEGLLTRWQPR